MAKKKQIVVEEPLETGMISEPEPERDSSRMTKEEIQLMESERARR